MRLFRTGDLCFSEQKLRSPGGGTLNKYPDRVLSYYTSTNYYEINQTDCPRWKVFAQNAFDSPGWNSSWFGIAQRFFLYGAGKEFNSDWDAVDRVVDYMIALEAVLAPDGDGGFLKRRVQKRGAKLLGSEATEALLGEFYDVRSTIAHGSPLGDKHRETLTNMPAFEDAVRKILVTAVAQIPKDKDGRQEVLENLYNPSKAEREESAVEAFERTIEKKYRPGVVEKLRLKYPARN